MLGPVAGFAVGVAGSWVMGRVDQRFHIRPEYQSLYGIGLVLGAFVIGEAAGGDGFLAAFAAGLAVTAFNQTLCDCFLEFGQVIAETTMLLAFVLFGAVLSSLVGEVPLLATLALAALAIFIIRPLVVRSVLRLGRAGLSRYARQFIGWFGPRGLASLLFALLVVEDGVPGGEQLFAQSPDDISRVTPAELSQRLAGPNPPVVLDVRSRSEYARDGVRIRGSVQVLPDQVTEWAADRLRDQPYVLYCT